MKNGSFLAPGLALIFDMDGVVLDSTEVHTRAWDLYLERLGVYEEGLMDRMLGKRNDEIVRGLFGAAMAESEVDEHGAAKERLYREMMAPVFGEKVVPGVVQFIRKAHDAGVPLAMATNAEPPNVDFVLDRTGLREVFQAVVDGHQVENPKPHPDVYLEAAARIGVDPANCIVFEDSPGGMRAAVAAGTRLVAILTTVDEAPQAQLAIPNFNDEKLMAWLRSQTPVAR